MLASGAIVLVDSMIVIEAVRTRCWNAITGMLRVVTVGECAAELRSGEHTSPGYVPVGENDIERMEVVPVPDAAAVTFRLKHPKADGLDPAERELLAHALDRNDVFFISSCDKAVVRTVHDMGLLDQLVSLEAVATATGARPGPRLKVQHTETRMSEWRTAVRLGSYI